MKKTYLLLLTMACSSVANTGDAQDSSIDLERLEWFCIQQGVKQKEDRNMEEINSLISRLEDKEPITGSVARTLYVCHKVAGNYSVSLEYLDKAMNAEVDVPFAFMERGDLNQKLDRYEEAVQDYSTQLRKHPKDREVLISRGDAFYRLEKLKDALEDYSRALELFKERRPCDSGCSDYSPFEIELYEKIFRVLSNLGRNEKAKGYLDEAVIRNAEAADEIVGRFNALFADRQKKRKRERERP